MKLGIMQPYFFPYLGYFELIHAVDHWIIFDTPQYIRHGWVNRNRILHPQRGWQYIIVPLRRHHRETPISEILINDSTDWRARIVGQLDHYRKQAPYFRSTLELVRQVISRKTGYLAELNAGGLSAVCQMLGVEFSYEFLSDMNLDLPEIDGPGDWALRIAQAVGADEYINPVGGTPLFDADRFLTAGIRLTLRNQSVFQYRCGAREFLPGLSIIDVLMWVSVDDIRRHLNETNPTNPGGRSCRLRPPIASSTSTPSMSSICG